MNSPHRVGMIVPSSNVTMETEIPAMLRSRPEVYREEFTFHGSRMRMQEVTPEELAKMDAQSVDCATELSDAHCDVISYACLIGIMAQKPGYHVESERKLQEATADNGGEAPVVTSAGALVRAVNALNANKIALIAPYLQNLTDTVIEYFEEEGVEVVDHTSLECPDNLEVAQLDPRNLVSLAKGLEIEDADALVLSACVQMPSLQSVQVVEDRLDVPVLSASIATVWDALLALDLNPRVPECGTLLSGEIINSPRVDR